jgi:hypothetical protein
MPVQEQKAAPKVHRVSKPEAAKKAEAKTPEASEDTAPVATSVPLDKVVAEEPSVTEDSLEDIDLEEDEEDQSTVDDEDDDSDLSLLEDGQSPPTKKVVAASEEPEEAFLEVYSENCLSCKSLIPFATKRHKGCHFSAGNKSCPAVATQIVIRVPLEDIVPRFMAAEKAHDFSRLARLNAKLAEKPDWYQERVAQALNEARIKNKT